MCDAYRVPTQSKIVVVGAGFGGIHAAKILAKQAGRQAQIVLIDKRNYHLFQPLLYQVAMAGLSPAEIAYPVRRIFRNRDNVEVILGEVKNIDLHRRIVTGSFKDQAYDFLVVACGSNHSYFSHPEWEEDAPGLKTLEQATEIRRRVFISFERAESFPDSPDKEKWMTFAVVGAGPTGVELAGALSEISRSGISREFRNIDTKRTRILLVEAGDRVLPTFDPVLSKRAMEDLEDMGVEVRLNTKVVDVSGDSLSLHTGESIRTGTIIWAAGVAPSNLNRQLESELDRAGRVVVEPDLTLKNFPEVFVIGDQAHAKDSEGKPFPGLASVAIQQGRFVGRCIAARLRAPERFRDQKPVFRYIDKGIMATIGRTKAVAQFHALKFGGFPAWVLWLFVHIYFLVGFRNRAFVIAQWTYSYFLFGRGARLISEKNWRSTNEHGRSPQVS